MKILNIIFFFTIALTACGQVKSHEDVNGIAYARKELEMALADKSVHNVVDNKRIILNDSVTAIAVAEPILFSIYGRGNILKQRPYQSYLIDKHWVISGSYSMDYLGGVFLIIIDSRDGRIIKITHGK